MLLAAGALASQPGVVHAAFASNSRALLGLLR